MITREARSRKARQSQRKGKVGEREVAELLSKAFYPNGDGFLRRTPMSGGWGGLPVLCGDLVPIRDDKIDDRWPFYWEVKRRKRATFAPFELLAGRTGILGKWYNEMLTKSSTLEFPLLVWRADRTDWFVFMSGCVFDALSHSFGNYPRESAILVINSVDEAKGDFINLSLVDFVKWFVGKKVMKGNPNA
jgi:hypothetical protein